MADADVCEMVKGKWAGLDNWTCRRCGFASINGDHAAEQQTKLCPKLKSK